MGFWFLYVCNFGQLVWDSGYIVWEVLKTKSDKLRTVAGGGQRSSYGSSYQQPQQEAPLSDAEFEEIMNRNRTVSSSAISRAVRCATN